MRVFAALLACLGIAATLPSTTARVIFFVAGLAVFLPMSWLWLLRPPERNALRRYLGLGTMRSENVTF